MFNSAVNESILQRDQSSSHVPYCFAVDSATGKDVLSPYRLQRRSTHQENILAGLEGDPKAFALSYNLYIDMTSLVHRKYLLSDELVDIVRTQPYLFKVGSRHLAEVSAPLLRNSASIPALTSSFVKTSSIFSAFP